MAKRKCYLGTAAGILAYEVQDTPDGKLRFEKLLHAMPERFFGQVLADPQPPGVLYAGSTPGLHGVVPGSATIPGVDPTTRDGALLYRSTDGGLSWDPTDRGIGVAGVRSSRRTRRPAPSTPRATGRRRSSAAATGRRPGKR